MEGVPIKILGRTTLISFCGLVVCPYLCRPWLVTRLINIPEIFQVFTVKYFKCCRFDSNTDKRVEYKMHNDVFLTNYEVFDIVVKYCLECSLLLLEKKN